MYLALDPGETTGYALFNKEGNLVDNAEVFSDAELEVLLDSLSPTVLVVEDWITNPHIRMGNNRQKTARTIGVVESWARRHNAQVIFQPNTVKSIAYRWAGIPKPKNKALEHRADAYVHGVYYLQKNGIRKPQQGAAK